MNCQDMCDLGAVGDFKENEGRHERVKDAYPTKPARLQTDAVKEFLNKAGQGLLKRAGVPHFVSNSDQKATFVEGFNWTLNYRIWIYFTAHHTGLYLEILPKIVDSDYNTYQGTIGRATSELRKKENEI